LDFFFFRSELTRSDDIFVHNFSKPKKTPKDSKETKDSRDFKEQKEGPKKSSPRDPSSHSFTLLEAVVNDDLEQGTLLFF
jgi:hypothetical protein